MTLAQIEQLSKAELDHFINVKCHAFDDTMTFNEYKEAVRDYIYIWRRLCEGRKAYTWEGVTDRVEVDIVVVEHYYNEQAPVDDAAVDVDYACG